ncbi:AB hydrolase-1 domain-containing protein [Mycena indigotica]|uniref:AB hydrolase-1 domain-containing protein n=1 Tax=Mycena indigotica TaxID=2126181 RepID=A0A8H6SIC3_9AGAR|nr:AB hydrolase-1 domain-containing protein [Mycena indigotica]KAF7299310.1 AB hydrolase-1 domain-containing protein [Mycena indigotica]
MGFFQAARKVFAGLGILYGIAIVALTVPYLQTQLSKTPIVNDTLLTSLRIPWGSRYDAPELYGLAPNKTANVKIGTADNETIGAWFVLSEPFYQSLPQIPTSHPIDLIPAALKAHPTILFLHGNAGTRAYRARIHHYTAFSSRLRANVLAIDYRGYGDSTGSPTEAGVLRDARAAWDWLIERGATASQIVIVGHSLGTGISALLSAELSDEGISPRGVALLSPFSSISKPLAMIPFATDLVQKTLVHRFDTDRLVPRMKGPILIAHAENDWDIPYTHSVALFDTFLDPFLPISPSLPQNAAALSHEDWSAFNTQLSLRNSVRAELISTSVLHNFGTLQQFNDTAHGRKILYVQSLAGGHDYLGVQEGVQDAIGEMFHLTDQA